MGKKWAGNAKEGAQGFQRTTPKPAKPFFRGSKVKKSDSPEPELSGISSTSTSSYDSAYGAFQESTGKKKQYRAYDSKNHPIGWYPTEQQATMAALQVGGWVREYEKKEEESLPQWLLSDKRPIEATDGKGFDIPELSAFERPPAKYKVVDAKGNSKGSFEDEYEARMKAEEIGGKVDKYVLKPAYRYKNPKEHMSALERLRDNGEPYEKVKKRR